MMKSVTTSLLLALAGSVVVGCAGLKASENTPSSVAISDQSVAMSGDTAKMQEAAKIEMEAQRLAQEQARLRAETQRLSEERAAFEHQRTVAAAMAPSGSMAASGDLFPPNPKAGECYARVLIPATFQTTQETMLKREASERIQVIPAEYETITEKLLVKQASTRVEVVPAVYETVTERVLDQPAHTVWKRGPASLHSGSGKILQVAGSQDTGELMCLVEVPATYKTVTRKVVAKPATTRTFEIPAVYKTVKQRIVKKPASTHKVQIPAEYANVTKTAKVSEGRLEWRSVLCQVNMTKPNVTKLQNALQRAGYYKGPIDGIIGPQTLGASNAYAKHKGLPTGSNYIATTVASSLGLTK